MNAIELIAVGALTVADDNVREDVGDVSELAASIKSVGVIEPLIVTDELVVVCGTRRLAAARMARLKEVPVVRRAFTEQERIATMVIENLQRADLTAIEEAGALKRLVNLGMKQTQIATMIGRSQAFVSKRLSLLDLPMEAQEAVHAGTVTLDAGVELAKVADNTKLVSKILKDVEKSPYEASRIAGTVGRELSKRKRAEEIAAATAELIKAGEKKVVPMKFDEYGYTNKPPKGFVIVKASTYQPHEIEMPIAQHAKLACHAVAVDPRDVTKTIELCSEPTSHKTKKEKADAARQRQQAKLDARQAAWDEGVVRRSDWLKSWIATKVDPNVVVELVYLASTGGSPHREKTSVTELLGIEVPEGSDYGTPRRLTTQFGDRSAINRRRVVMAMALSKLEAAIAYPGQAWEIEQRSYFAILVSHKYDLSENEKELLAELERELAEDELEVHAGEGEEPEPEPESDDKEVAA